MAKQTVTTTEYTDDLDGGRAHQTVKFAFDGSAYEIDLSKANTRAFGRMMALYVGHARKVRGTRSVAGRSTRGTTPQPAEPARDLAAVREWARTAGYQVSNRGRVAAAIIEAYDAGR